MAEPLEKPVSEPAPEVNFEELMDIGGTENTPIEATNNESTDDLVQKLSGEDKKSVEQDEVQQVAQGETGRNDQTPAQEQTQEGKEATGEQQPVEDVNELKQQLEWYKMLYGENNQRPQYQPQTQIPPQQQIQQPIAPLQQQQQPNVFDNIQVTKEDLYDLLSGEP